MLWAEGLTPTDQTRLGASLHGLPEEVRGICMSTLVVLGWGRLLLLFWGGGGGYHVRMLAWRPLSCRTDTL
jgi:hypothetical protein